MTYPLESALWMDEFVSGAPMKSLAARAEVGLSVMIFRSSGDEFYF